MAIVYVRQSSLQQVQRHQSSTQLQYDLKSRLLEWGWSSVQIETIDDDLGKSAASAKGRPGFARLVSMISMGQVGLVIGRDASRLARSCSDWYRLLEICALCGTLIADADGVYNPGTYNDRLLLGLKGTMSEAELHLLKQRMHAGRRRKAERGELQFRLPMGYVWSEDGQIVQDPDERARAAVSAVFEKFSETATINATLRYLVDNNIQMPCRRRSPPDKGKIEWRRPNRITLGNILHHPIYAGAYVYGRRPTDPQRKTEGRPSTGRVVADPKNWQSLIPNNHAGYISWETYRVNQRQLEANRISVQGVSRPGAALLPGLLVCAKCGCRLQVSYSDKKNYRYQCVNDLINYGGQTCQSLHGKRLDEWVESQVLKALEPASLELSLSVMKRAEEQRSQLREHWDRQLEQAQYEVNRAWRQYDAVEPENRLVARTLEQRWNQALITLKRLERDRDQAVSTQIAELSSSEKRQILALAQDIPGLWRADTTTAQDRQQIARTMIDKIEIEVIGESERVELTITWSGGHQSKAALRRPVARWEQVSYYSRILDQLKTWREQGLKQSEIVDRLNAHPDWFPPKRTMLFNKGIVSNLMSRLTPRKKRGAKKRKKQSKNTWSVSGLASELGMPVATVYAWIGKGYIEGKKEKIGSRSQWVIHANQDKLEELRQRRAQRRTWVHHKRVSDHNT